MVKTFHQAKRQIFIDDEVLKKAINWMISHQASDGRFPEPGRVIHKDMQVSKWALLRQNLSFGFLTKRVWLSFVVSYCEFVTFPLVSWVRCGK